ncbi:MAG: PD-(D/E)XK nuclease family transposase, partial [Eubacteriales bacterium]|nr:PD-(D/E)XK nuclease family transposase [Eubacteriales bacterium]
MDSNIGLEQTLQSFDGRNIFDTPAKRLFSRKEILSVILKYVVSEYKDCTTEEIMEFIEGSTIKTGTAAVSPDMSNTIEGINTESRIKGEAASHFDILFKTLLPESENKITVNLYVDLEIQKNARPGYPIEKRAVYYAARRISMQLLKVSDVEKGYGALEKVYSIWICADNVPKEEQNSISYHKMINYRHDNIAANSTSDLMEIVIIRLGEEYVGEGLLDMIYGIFDGNKEKVFKYIPKTNTASLKEVEEMLSLTEFAEKRG